MKNTFFIPLAGLACLLPGLTQAAQLDPVVVTANNLQQPLSSTISPTYVVTREEIDEKGWETVAEVLQHLPGITITNNGGIGQATNVLIRGQNGNGILFLIDGEMVADPSNTTLSPQIENLPLSNVERIEVVQGPQSGVWGANASGGVINFITRKAGTNAFSVQAGSENTRRFSAILGQRFKGGDFSIHVAELNTDGYTAIKPYGSNGKGHEKDGYHQSDIGFKIGIDANEHHRFEIQLDRTTASAEFDNTYPSYDPDNTDNRNERTLLNKVARYRYQNDRWQGRLQISEYTVDRISYSGYGAYPYQGNLTTFAGQLGYRYAGQDTLQLSAGNQRVQGNSDAYWHDWAGLTHVHHLGRLSLVEALRYDNYDRFKDATTGKIGLSLPLLNGVNLKANYGTGYNAPSPFQVSYGKTKDLKPESTTGWDATLSGYGAQLTYFDQETTDAITYAGTWPNDYYTNASGKNTYKGWLFSYQRAIGPVALALNYSWLEARNDQGQLLLRRPLQEGSLLLDYYPNTKWHVGTVIHHIGDMYDTNGSTGYNLGNYSVVDLKVDYSLNRHFTVFAKAINLFDEDYATAGDQNNPPQYVYNTGGFQWRIGLHGKF